jgi:hypothetical protein
MFQRFASSAFVAGTLLTALLPAVGLARDHGGRSSSGRSVQSSGNRSSSGGSHNYAPRGGGSRYSGGQNFVSPRASEVRRGYSGGPSYYSRGYVAPRSYGRVYPGYYGGSGYYGGGVYLGVPYGYAYGPGYGYDPGYAYDPGYSSGPYGPAPAPQTCSQGSYDQYGTWVPNPNCYSNQQQYAAPQPQQNYNQQQYPQPQQNYNYNQQQYPPQQQPYYDPNQPQQYGR